MQLLIGPSHKPGHRVSLLPIWRTNLLQSVPLLLPVPTTGPLVLRSWGQKERQKCRQMLSQGSGKSCGYTTQAKAVSSALSAKSSLPTALHSCITGTQKPFTGHFICFQYTCEQLIWCLCALPIFTNHLPSTGLWVRVVFYYKLTQLSG